MGDRCIISTADGLCDSHVCQNYFQLLLY